MISCEPNARLSSIGAGLGLPLHTLPMPKHCLQNDDNRMVNMSDLISIFVNGHFMLHVTP